MQIAADSIDRLMMVEIRQRAGNRGFKWTLYETARAASDKPLVMAAAEALDIPPARIAIVTGAAVPEHMPVGENDGPFGAAVLAQALVAIGHQVEIWTDPVCATPIEGVLRHLKVAVPVRVLGMNDDVQQRGIAEENDVLVAIERLGGNVHGNIHGINGRVRNAFRTRVDTMFHRAAELGCTTIGIGDGGNEVGFGKIRDALIARAPEHNQADKTPCGGGIFAATATDILVVGTTSNIGAYGVVAALAMRRGDITLCHPGEVEEGLHYVGVGLGLADGGGGGIIPSCDGIPAKANAAMATLLQAVVQRYLDPPRVRAF
ncbi:glutamate cyclase domain-containing protein [Roseomonas sp. WA12]